MLMHFGFLQHLVFEIFNSTYSENAILTLKRSLFAATLSLARSSNFSSSTQREKKEAEHNDSISY